jgi:hypothetical protein
MPRTTSRPPLRVAVCGETHTLAVEYYADDAEGDDHSGPATATNAAALSSAAAAAARWSAAAKKNSPLILRTARVVVPCAWLDAQAAMTGHGGGPSAADVADAAARALPAAASRGASRSQLRRLCIHVVAAHRARECGGRVRGRGNGVDARVEDEEEEHQEEEEERAFGGGGGGGGDGDKAAGAANNDDDDNPLIEVDLADLGLDD